mgnify:CR=1 FL=1
MDNWNNYKKDIAKYVNENSIDTLETQMAKWLFDKKISTKRAKRLKIKKKRYKPLTLSNKYKLGQLGLNYFQYLATLKGVQIHKTIKDYATDKEYEETGKQLIPRKVSMDRSIVSVIKRVERFKEAYDSKKENWKNMIKKLEKKKSKPIVKKMPNLIKIKPKIKKTPPKPTKTKKLTTTLMKKHLSQINKQLRKQLIKGIWKMKKAELTKTFNKHLEKMNAGWYRPAKDLTELYENKTWDFEAFKKL